MDFGTLPLNTIFVGDRLDTDILGANRVGIWSCRLMRGPAKNDIPSAFEYIPDYSIDNLTDIFNLPIFSLAESITDVVIPCGGRGTRMGSITKDKQKCMLPNNSSPILFYICKLLSKCGVQNIHFLLNYRSDEIVDYFSNIDNLNLNYIYHKTDKESTGESLYTVLEKLPEKFFYCHGNILFEPSLLFKLQKKYYMNNRKTTFVATKDKVAKTHPVFAIKDGIVIAIERHDRDLKKEEPFYSMGLGIINKEDAYCGTQESQNRQQTTEELFRRVIKKVDTFYSDGSWYHIENEQDLEEYGQFVDLIDRKVKCLNN